jgi:hypothetical protein
MKRRGHPPEILTFLLGGLACSVAFLPPELSASGLAMAAALAAGAGVLLLFPGEPLPGLRAGWRLPLSAGVAGLVTGVLTSSQPHRSTSFLMGAGLCLVAFGGAYRAASRERGKDFLLQWMAIPGGAAAAWGIHQRLFSLAETARILRASGQPDLDSEILRAESGRAFGPFLLPSALGIYLAMVIPLSLRCGIRSGWRGARGFFWGGLLVLQVAGLCASLSYGAVACLVAASFLLLMRFPVPGRRWWLAGLGLLTASAMAGIYLVRGGEGISPLLLRAGNWSAAVKIFLGAPFFGVGLGNFADAYARGMSAGMNETAYVHNSFLQIAAEGGALAMAWCLFGAGALLARILRGREPNEGHWERILEAIPPVAFLAHNLIDFSAYLPSLSILFALSAGAALRRGEEGRENPIPDSDSRFALPRGALLVLLMGGALWEFREAWTRRALEEGRELAMEGRTAEATGLLGQAARMDPLDPDPPALLAEICLSESAGTPALRLLGEAYARSAVRLRPERAYGHFILSMYRAAAGDRGEAWTEMTRARELFPTRERYSREAGRLRDSIAADGKNGAQADVGR